MSSSDEARIMALIENIVACADEFDGGKRDAKEYAEQLVAVATAAAYRHAAAYCRKALDVPRDPVEFGGFGEGCRATHEALAGYFDAWAEKAEAEKGQP